MSLPDGLAIRCSALVARGTEVLLVRRTGNAASTWSLPGGTPRQSESMAACARREVLEETGLHVDPSGVAFVLEVLAPDGGPRTVDMVFLARLANPGQRPRQVEPDLEPAFMPLSDLQDLDLRPPLAGHLRGLLGQRTPRYAPYLANLWRPDLAQPPGSTGKSAWAAASRLNPANWPRVRF
ncbi:MAG TPA: NUDIX hydrolase [Streptosporangiaceae bacterium]|nr:NUDIX hydrolase [Streptosporangiaceae bacterium]